MKNFFKSLFGRNHDDVESESAENTYTANGDSHESQSENGFRPEINRTVMPEADPEPVAVADPQPLAAPEATSPIAAPTPDIVLCVPGPWSDWSAFVAATAQSTDGAFVAAAQRLLHVNAKYSMEVQFSAQDENMELAFRNARADRIRDFQFAGIAGHKSIVYLTAPAGSLEDVFAAAECAAALTRAGGFGVKVETAGSAFNPEDWQELSTDNIGFVTAFLVLVRDGQDAIRSFGLRSFGLPDVICSSSNPDFDLDELANTFLKYQLFERPGLQDGETFSTAADAPSFRITHVADTKSAPGSTFFNPYGFITLTPAGSRV